MIQSIYTSVTNADVVPCGKKGKLISSDPIPLLKSNYLSEYRTELEKAKVRKNLGIADDAVIEWGNITGHIEDNPDLREALSYKLPEHLEDIIKKDFSSVKGALGWAIEYLSTFVMDTESIAWLKEETASIRQSIQEKENLIYTYINNLTNDVLNNINSIIEVLQSIQSINESISKINESLLSIDSNILNWIKNALSDSVILTENNKIEVNILKAENNAITVGEQGLFVLDLSSEVSDATLNIEILQTNVQEIFSTYVTKDLLGGDGDFNFVKQESFDQHTNLANTKFEEIDEELNRTVKTGEDGHVDTLYVNTLSNQEGNIKIDKPLEVLTGVPLDVRTVVESIEDLYKMSPKTAYAGMAVANVGDGNIYMLIDPTRITEKGGWKASYESLQIITCTQEEYEAMAANTNDDYTPKQEGLSFLYQGTYYYIYEEEENSQYYVTKKQIEDWLGAKASKTEVNNFKKEFQNHIKDYQSLNTSVTELISNISNNYITAEQISETYATIESLKLVDDKFSEYYTAEKTDELFVTKESLRGDLEGEDDFVFVTLNLYNLDKENSANKISTKELVLSEKSIIIDNDNLLVDNKEIAFKEIVPKIELIETKEAYDNLPEKDPETYYYICDDKIIGYMTKNDALDTFYTKAQVNEAISKKLTEFIDNYIVPLQERITALENARP